MLFPVLLILASIWTSTDGALVCPTVKGGQCVFPFKSGSTEYNECASYKGRHWCATSVNADKTYKSYDYCKKDECKEEEEKEKKAVGPCLACIVRYAPVCLPVCYPDPNNKACDICLLENAIECAFICGFDDSIKDSEYGLEGVRDYLLEGETGEQNRKAKTVGAPPSCVMRGKAFHGSLIIDISTVNSAADCGSFCNDNFEATACWSWFTANINNGRNAKKCVCLEVCAANPVTRPFVDSGYGVNNVKPQCPPPVGGKEQLAAQLAAQVAAIQG